MAKPKFYLEPRPTPHGKQAINMFFSFNGQRLQYYTQIRIEPKYFRAECNTSDTIKPIRSTAPFASQYNKSLSDLAHDAVSIVKQARGEKLTAQYVRDQLDILYKPKNKPEEVQENSDSPKTLICSFEKLIQDSKDGVRLIDSGKKKGSRYSFNTIKNYGVTLAALKRYLEYKKIKEIPLEKVNKGFYEDFRYFCYEVEEKEPSTFGSYVKDVKTLMRENPSDQFKSEVFVIPSYEADTIYLTMDQIDQVASFDFSDSQKFFPRQVIKRNRKGIVTENGKPIYREEKVGFSTLQKVRDLFLIGCYSGLRFSDLSKLDIKNIDGNYINIKQTKTGNRISIPIMKKLKPVLSKYSEALPTISNQKFNTYIKIVALLAGLTDLKEVTNSKGNKYDKATSPLYQLISSHCCRRSYATNMFKANVPPMLIMSATGHKSESSFMKYIRATSDEKANLLAEVYQKLGL